MQARQLGTELPVDIEHRKRGGSLLAEGATLHVIESTGFAALGAIKFKRGTRRPVYCCQSRSGRLAGANDQVSAN